MAHSTLGSLAFFLLSALLLAHGLGWLFVRLRQPRVIGEILAGVIMGPTLLGQIWYQSFPIEKGALPLPLELCYQLGLLLLMFLSSCRSTSMSARNIGIRTRRFRSGRPRSRSRMSAGSAGSPGR